MSAINDLIRQIENPELRSRIEAEINRMNKQKKFGLVFEEHLPECTPLYDVPVRRGALVSRKSGKLDTLYRVLEISGKEAVCIKKEGTEKEVLPLSDLVTVAEFGEPIYPYLQPLDSVCNAPDSDLWHTLIEADNYHALQLLEYLYAGKVDCIYIDPPYNTGDNDWKYNNDYVDKFDVYRHSKWLSMMQKRLKLAKKLLNPDDSVLIVTIDEKEYLHLGCLLEEMFPEAKIQMISSVISRKGVARMNEFTRVNEFIYFVMMGDYELLALDNAEYALEGESVHWQTFRRSDYASRRGTVKGGTAQFYPIYVDNISKKIVKIGDPLTPEIDRNSVPQIEGCTAVFPVRDDGTEMNWGVLGTEAARRAELGYLRANSYTPQKPQQYVIQYLMGGTISAIENGKIVVKGYAENGSVIAENLETKRIMPRTQWDFASHDARDNGTKILKSILGELRFDFPKSLYAVRDSINYFLHDKKDALIVDFFAGSGTTLHAVNLLNAEDGGNRCCILVTNNEVSSEEAKTLTAQGYNPGDEEWDKLGIARSVTWPRTVCSIKGIDVNGDELKGNYGCEIDKMIEVEGEITDPDTGKKLRGKYYKKAKEAIYPSISNISMSDGFKANAAFFKLGFLDKNAVALGRQFKEMIPTLWLKAGAHGKCPEVAEELPEMLILDENRFAVLLNETAYPEFETEIQNHPDIETLYIITDSEAGFREMTAGFPDKASYQLYRDYLDNFRINITR